MVVKVEVVVVKVVVVVVLVVAGDDPSWSTVHNIFMHHRLLSHFDGSSLHEFRADKYYNVLHSRSSWKTPNYKFNHKIFMSNLTLMRLWAVGAPVNLVF